MLETGKNLPLVAKTGNHERRIVPGPHQFDSHLLTVLIVNSNCAIYLAHPSFPDLLDNLIRTKLRPTIKVAIRSSSGSSAVSATLKKPEFISKMRSEQFFNLATEVGVRPREFLNRLRMAALHTLKRRLELFLYIAPFFRIHTLRLYSWHGEAISVRLPIPV